MINTQLILIFIIFLLIILINLNKKCNFTNYESTQKKLFVVLEQGNKPNTKLARKHKNMFTTDYSDCFRLNWQNNKEDKIADFYKDNITWSEGRSLLYDKVKGKYKYYIFIDDDVDFKSNTSKPVSEEIKYFFENYNPITGTFEGVSWINKNINDIKNKEVSIIQNHDLCCQYFQEDYVDLVFPIIFHGSEASTWYCQFIIYQLFPQKFMLYKNVIIKNTENIPHKDSEKKHYKSREKIVKLFNNLIIHDSDKKKWNEIWLNNQTEQNIRNISLDKSKIKITKKDISKIININSDEYNNRTIFYTKNR